MKKSGSVSDFGIERDAAIMRAYRDEARHSRVICVDEIAKRIVMRPCQRFWVSEERATAVISAMVRGMSILEGMLPTKQRMFLEIHRRVESLRKHRPRVRLSMLVAEIINSPAPEFYLSPRYVRDIINDVRAQRR